MTKKKIETYESKAAYLEAVSSPPNTPSQKATKLNQQERWEKSGKDAASAAVKFALSRTRRK
jgi:hypothetical protein